LEKKDEQQEKFEGRRGLMEKE